MIKTVKIEDVKKNLPDDMVPQFESKLELLLKETDEKREGWTQAVDKSGLVLYTKSDNVWIVQRSETIIDFPIETLVPYLSDPEFRAKYDNLLDGYEIIQKISDNVQLIRSQIKGKYLIISPRDFVTYRINGWLDDDVLVV